MNGFQLREIQRRSQEIYNYGIISHNEVIHNMAIKAAHKVLSRQYECDRIQKKRKTFPVSEYIFIQKLLSEKLINPCLNESDREIWKGAIFSFKTILAQYFTKEILRQKGKIR